MKAFLSSIIRGYGEIRDAAEEAATSLDVEVVRAERFPASASSPLVACLSGVRECEIVLLILGAAYGTPQADGRSATHAEFDEALATQKDVLVFVEEGVEREPRQQRFIDSLGSWKDGKHWRSFRTPTQLGREVARSLHAHLVRAASERPDADEIARRADSLIPRRTRRNSAALALAVAGPPVQIVRPLRLDEDSFRKSLLKEAMFGQYAILDPTAKTDVGMEGDALRLEQSGAALSIDPLASMLIDGRAQTGEARLALIEEDLMEKLDRYLSFAIAALDELDSSHRLSHLAVRVALLDAGWLGWKTRVEEQRNPGSATMGNAGERIAVGLSPPLRSRLALSRERRTIVEDLLQALRRLHSPRRSPHG